MALCNWIKGDSCDKIIYIQFNFNSPSFKFALRSEGKNKMRGKFSLFTVGAAVTNRKKIGLRLKGSRMQVKVSPL